MEDISKNPEKHRERHRKLHLSLDELVADWIRHTNKLPSRSTILELLDWSYGQCANPQVDELEKE